MSNPHDRFPGLARFSTIFPQGSRPWKQRALAAMLTGLVGITLLAGCPAPAQAAPANPEALKLLAFVDLGVLDSQPGEAKDGFMLRVGRVLDDFTERSGHEACGAIMANPDNTRWRVRLITNRAQLGCVRMVFDEPGYELTAETIHSHPTPTLLRTNARDSMLRNMTCGAMVELDGSRFSDGDRANEGGGYLVTRGQLLHRDTNGQETTVGPIDRNSALPALVVLPNDTGRMEAGDGYVKTPVPMAATQITWSRGDGPDQPIVGCKAAQKARDALWRKSR